MKKIKSKIQTTSQKANEEITRKEALKKAGKYAALTAAAMFIVLSPKAQSTSAITPGWGP